MKFPSCLLIPAVAFACFALAPERPVCDAQHGGEIWRPAHPDSACGGPEICTVKRHKYRWEALTVHVSQLSKDPRERPAACEAAPHPTPPADTPSAAQHRQPHDIVISFHTPAGGWSKNPRFGGHGFADAAAA